MTSKPETFALLKDSLDEAQISVRAYDTKAQIVGVGYIFALNVIGNIGELGVTQETANIVTIVVAWFLVVMPIILFGYVLYPVRKSSITGTGDGRRHFFYLHPDRYKTTAELVEAVDASDPTDEIAHELIQISKIRESKRKRFVTALASAGFTFALLFASQLLLNAKVL